MQTGTQTEGGNGKPDTSTEAKTGDKTGAKTGSVEDRLAALEKRAEQTIKHVHTTTWQDTLLVVGGGILLAGGGSAGYYLSKRYIGGA